MLGAAVTRPDQRPSRATAERRVMPGVGALSPPSSSRVIRLISDVTFVPSSLVVRAPALVLDVQLRTSLREPVVDDPQDGGVARERCVAVVLVRAVQMHVR